MKVITRKSEIKELLAVCFDAYRAEGLQRTIEIFNEKILAEKVKFPLLEFCGEQFYDLLPEREHLLFCDQVHALRTEGGNVILGIVLQKRLTNNFDESLEKATHYVSQADIWYVCDIIGERVYGYSLLQNPTATIAAINQLSDHPTNWVIRALGAGMHYAIKKGLSREHVKTLFKILLSLADTKDKEIRQGIGWAAKTTAKFHPDIISLFRDQIENEESVANWFRTKIAIGLNRNHYAKGNHS